MKLDNPLLKIDGAALCVLAAVTVGAYFVGAQPILDSRAAAVAQERTIAGRETEADEKEAALRQTEARLAQVSAELDSSTIRLEGLSQTNARVAALTKLATDQRLEINEIKLGQADVQVRYTRVPLRITGTGTYLACALYLHRLRSDYRDTGVVAFEVNGDPSGDGTSIKFIFDLVWYTAPEARASAESAGGA